MLSGASRALIAGLLFVALAAGAYRAVVATPEAQAAVRRVVVVRE